MAVQRTLTSLAAVTSILLQLAVVHGFAAMNSKSYKTYKYDRSRNHKHYASSPLNECDFPAGSSAESSFLKLSSPLLRYLFEEVRNPIQNNLKPISSAGMTNFQHSAASENGEVLADSSQLMLTSPLLDAPHSAHLVAAELMGDAAHIVLDFAPFFVPSRISTHAVSILGRILSVAADYLPDQTMLPEEFAFQAIMLTYSVFKFSQAVIPLLMASFSSSSNDNISFRDCRMFKDVFQPAGLTWAQYKALSVTTLDWVTKDPGTTIMEPSSLEQINGDHIFVLYEGSVNVEKEGKLVHSIGRRMRDNDNDATVNHQLRKSNLVLFGDENLARKMDCSILDPHLSPKMTLKAGPSGATFLRMNTPELIKWMENDAALASSVRRLLFMGIQGKMSSLLETSR